jgi:hypothetical protein
MGQQQLLLLILASIIVGVAVLIGVNMFQENAAQANMDGVTQDCLTIAARAQAWYRRPAQMGGGGQAWTGIDFHDLSFRENPDDNDAATYSNDNGSYALAIVGGNLQITGNGKETMPGAAGKLKVVTTVTTNNVSVDQTQTQ